ncbi:MAG: putative Ig domain-containing protein [Dehalococcoidia bacterium]|nr:putative Ig domain-containing protein [Dehalococcoidia bacterium]
MNSGMRDIKAIVICAARLILACLMASTLALLGTVFFAATPAHAQQITVSLPTATVGKPYTASFQQVGACGGGWGGLTALGPVFAQFPGVVPAVTPTTWSISGIPQGPSGTWNVVIDDGGVCGPLNLTFTVVDPHLTFNTAMLPPGEESILYYTMLRASASAPPLTYTLVNGMLPPGLGLSPNGVISGVPIPGTFGNYYFTVQVTDSTQPAALLPAPLQPPPLTAQQSFFILIQRGRYTASISIGEGLEHGRTNVYTGGELAGDLEGGESGSFLVPLGEGSTVRVQETVDDPTQEGVRYKAEDAEQRVNQSDPNAYFVYYAEYLIDLQTDPSGIASLAGSGWQPAGTTVRASAPEVVEPPGEEGTQYRFSHWWLPDGAKASDQDLVVTVDEPGSCIARYDTYYLLTLTSEYSDDQTSWHLAGSQPEWSVASPEVRMPGIVGAFGGKYKAVNPSGTAHMTVPQTVTVEYESHYALAAFLMSLVALTIIAAGYGVYRYALQPRLAPALPPSRAARRLPPERKRLRAAARAGRKPAETVVVLEEPPPTQAKKRKRLAPPGTRALPEGRGAAPSTEPKKKRRPTKKKTTGPKKTTPQKKTAPTASRAQRPTEPKKKPLRKGTTPAKASRPASRTGSKRTPPHKG